MSVMKGEYIGNSSWGSECVCVRGGGGGGG